MVTSETCFVCGKVIEEVVTIDGVEKVCACCDNDDYYQEELEAV